MPVQAHVSAVDAKLSNVDQMRTYAQAAAYDFTHAAGKDSGKAGNVSIARRHFLYSVVASGMRQHADERSCAGSPHGGFRNAAEQPSVGARVRYD